MATLKNDPLKRPVDVLQQALQRDEGGDGGAWVRDVDSALTDLAQGLRIHNLAADSPGGTFGILKEPEREMMATLERRVGHLRENQVKLLSEVADLQARVQSALQQPANASAAPDSDISGIRKTGGELLTRLREHLEGETRLLMETLTTEVGAGD